MTPANDNVSDVVLHKHLSVLAYAQGFTLWHYHADTANQLLDQVAQSRFWLPAVADDEWRPGMIRTGDRIMVSAPDGFIDLGVVLAGVHQGDRPGDRPRPHIEVVTVAMRRSDTGLRRTKG